MNDQAYYKRLVETSAKLILLDKLLPKIRAGGHKVLIFSQMVRVLDILETYLKSRGWGYERLDGSVRGNDRQSAIDRFGDSTQDRFVFLLCTRAGGVGINLAAANTVIIYDSDWNPQNDIQAQARCHRIGQTQEVKVYRLICAKTYERYMFEQASKKLGLDQAVLNNMGVTSDPSKMLDNKEIDNLLKYGAYDLFREDEKEVTEYKDEDIDKILERSERVVWNAAQDAKAGPSTFAKATFGSGTSVDMDAPDFWEKVLPEEQNVNWLVRKLNDESALKSTDETNQFMEVASKVMLGVQASWEEGLSEQAGQDIAILVDLFRRSTKEPRFNEQQRHTMGDWLDAIANPRRRRKQLFGSGHTPSRAQVERKFEKTPEDEKWSRAEKIRFHQAFFAYCCDTWLVIKEKGELFEKTLEEIYSYAKRFLDRCAELADEDDKTAFLQCAEELQPPSAADIQLDEQVKSVEGERQVLHKPVNDSTGYKKMMRKKMKGWVRRVRMMMLLRHEIESLKDPFHDLVIPAPFKALTTWWSRADDRSLLLGTYKHGFGYYEDMLRDNELTFNQHVTPPPPADIPVTTPARPKSRAGFGGQGSQSLEVLKVWTNAPQATSEDALTVRFTVKRVKNEDAETPVTASGDLSAEWPQSRSLDQHTKTLIESIMKIRKAYLRDKERQMRQTEKMSKKKLMSDAKRRERYKDWSKREEKDLRNAIIMFGGGYWEVLRVHAGLEHKDEGQIEEYFQNLMIMCRSIVSTNPKQLTGQDGEGKEKEEDEDEDELDDNDEDDKNTAQNTQSAMQSAASMMSANNRPTAPISVTMAKRLLKRVKLFSDLRTRVLTHPELKKRIDQARQGEMPAWWVPGMNDLALLEAVVKYGLGGKELWEEYLADENCPLYFAETGKPVYRKHKEKWLREFLVDRPPLVMRVIYLAQLVLDPEHVHDYVPNRRSSSSYFDIPREIMTRSQSTVGKRKREDGEEGDDDLSVEPVTKRARLSGGGSLLRFATRPVPRDDDGHVILPVTAKGATIHTLGTVVYDRANYHARNYIWPVGYKRYVQCISHWLLYSHNYSPLCIARVNCRALRTQRSKSYTRVKFSMVVIVLHSKSPLKMRQNQQ